MDGYYQGKGLLIKRIRGPLDNRKILIPVNGHSSMVQLTNIDVHLYYFFIKQVIDDLHFRNHKDADCRLRYDPAIIKQKHPQANLMCAEQFFSWLSRYKRILSSMSKTTCFICMCMIVKRRNSYTQKCYILNRLYPRNSGIS